MILMILITVFVSTQAWTQKTSFIQLSGGPSFPIGRFAEKGLPEAINPEIANPPGAAITGANLSIAAGYFLAEKVGFILSVSNSRNRQSSQAFRDALEKNNPNNIVTARTRHWSTTSVLAGLFIENRFNSVSKLSYHFNVETGVAFTVVPHYSYYIFNPQTTFATQVNSNKRKLPGSFAIATAGALKYAIGKLWYVHVTGEYFNAVPKRKFTFAPNFPDPGTQEVTQKRPQTSFRILTGAGVRF